MPSPDFTLSYRFAAAPAKVYEALATQAGVQHWWTEYCQMYSRVGGRALFLFPNADFYAVMDIATLDPPRRVEWNVVDAKHPDASGFVDLHDWVGTSIRFDLAPDGPDGTRLSFTHVGLVPLECAGTCSSLWSFFLGQSLRKYVETGTGEPAKAQVG